MECVHTNIKVNNTRICLYIIYRIPNTSVLLFCEELAQLFEKYFPTDTQNTILLRDLNIHMDDLQHPDTIMFNDFLDSFNPKNHVSFHTHTSKHHLDLCITDNTTNLVSRVTRGHVLSDHNFIHISLKNSKANPSNHKNHIQKAGKNWSWPIWGRHLVRSWDCKRTTWLGRKNWKNTILCVKQH